MMDFIQWRESVLNLIKEISNTEFQQRAWFGKSPHEVSSPDELVNWFFGDVQVPEFLSEHKERLTKFQLECGERLVRELDSYSQGGPEHSDPAFVVADPEWQHIRETASSFVGRLTSG